MTNETNGTDATDTTKPPGLMEAANLSERERTRRGIVTTAMHDAMTAMIADLLAQNVDAIAAELLLAADGTGAVGLRFGLVLSREALGLDGKIAWSRKFEDKRDQLVKLEDPEQPELGVGEDDTKITISSGGQTVETTSAGLAEAGRRIKRQIKKKL